MPLVARVATRTAREASGSPVVVIEVVIFRPVGQRHVVFAQRVMDEGWLPRPLRCRLRLDAVSVLPDPADDLEGGELDPAVGLVGMLVRVDAELDNRKFVGMLLMGGKVGLARLVDCPAASRGRRREGVNLAGFQVGKLDANCELPRVPRHALIVHFPHT
jgi:hypothetical protein